MRKSTVADCAIPGADAISVKAAKTRASECFMAQCLEEGRDDFTKLPRSRLLSRKKRLEGCDRFRRPHPFAEQVTFVVDAADQIFGRMLEKFSRCCDRLGGEGGDFARGFFGFGLEGIRRNHPVDEARAARLLGI